MAKSLRKRLEEEGKWKQIESTMKTTPKSSNSNNTSAKTMVDSVYNKKNTTSNNAWDRVMNRVNQLMNDTGNVFSNFGLGIKKAGESSLYYIEKMSSEKNTYVENKVWAKDRNEQINKNIEEKINTNKSNTELNLLTKDNFKISEESTINPLLYKSELLKDYENPILRNIQENIKEDETKIQKNIDNTEGKIMKKVAELTPSIGQSVAGMGASVINPGLGIAFWQTSAGGDYVRDAKARGMNDDDALLYGTIMGGMESATEWIGGELTKRVGKSFAKDGVVKGLKALGLDIGENFFEEAIMEPLQETISTITGGKETADWSNMTQRMLQSGIDGALTSILMGGASAGVGKAIKVVNKYSKGEKVSQQEIKEALEEINKKEELDIERILVSNFGFNSQDLYKNTTVQENLENKVSNISSELSQHEIKGILPQKQSSTIENNEVLNPGQQTIQTKQQNSQNQTSQQLQQNNEYLIKMPNSNYKFEASGNQKLDNLRQDASKYWNNSKATKSLVTNMEKIISDKDYSIRLDNTITDEKGNFVNGKITKENGETIITLNPNTNRAFEFLIGHEVGHAITTPEMKKLVIDFANKNSEFSNAIESLKQNYNVNQITDEVVSDIEGQLLGNQEFINNLSIEKPNVFKQIYDAIISIANKITGNSNESLFIRDLKNKYQKAYRETQGSNVEEGETSFSIENDKKLGKYWQIETQKDIFKSIKDNKQLQQKAFDYIFNGNKNYKIITDKIDNKDVKFARISASEFLYGTNSKKLDKQKYGQKMRMSTSIDDLIKNADITYHSPLEHNNKLFKAGFNNYQGKVGIDNNIFRYIVRIGKAKNDNLFYDVSLEFLGNKNGTEVTVPSAINTSPIKNSVPNNSITFKNNNVNTTEYSMQNSKSNTQYSKENIEWQDYLEKNFKSEGTRTFEKDVGLPQRPKLPEKKIESKVTTETFSKYKRNVIAGKEKEINNLIQIKNTTLNEIENNISKKQAQLDNLRNKKSVTAQKIKIQIESLKERYNRVENEYIERIERRNKKVNRALIEAETRKELKRTRKEIQKALLEKENISELKLDNAKNISAININRTDPIRLQEKIFGLEVGKKINEMFFEKVKHNTAEKTRFLNRERKEIENWGIKPRSKESEALQKYTEKTFVDEEGREFSYTEQDLIRDIPDEKIRTKIIEASKELRAKYDNYIETANDILVDLGYSPIPKRNDYVRHFTELNDIFSKYGIPGKFNDSLPTDINGITEQFRPGKNYFANAEKRIGNKTTYDAITGIDGYLEGISNLIYHTEDIQRLRAFDKYIRDIYGEHGFENFENLNDEEKNKRIELISENHLSEYVGWLTEYTNILAGKNSVFDRGPEKLIGRKVYSALNSIKKQTGSNMTGFNLGSALTNFVSVAQGASKTKKIALLKGFSSSLENIVVKDDFINKSDFLTNRFGSEALSKTIWEKMSNVGQIFMTATDYFSSNVIVRSKYYEQIAKGKTEAEAIKLADDFGARILGDRSQGSTANIFNSKILGIVTQFQLEVNNQLDTFIHDTKKDFIEAKNNEGLLKASMGAVWTLGQFAVLQHIFNEVFERINGNRPAFDVIEIMKTALGIENDEEDETITGNLQDAIGMLIEQLPFANLFSENARVPIASSIPNPIAIATGESTLKDEALKLTYLLPPTGGGQIKKTAEGIKTVLEGGSYFTNSKGEKELRFPVEDATAKDYLKAGVFGKYSLPLAKDYTEKDYKRLTAKETSLYDNSTIDYRTLNKYLDYSKTDDIKKNDKIKYIQNMNIKTEEKWDLYKYNIISSTEREDGTSQLSDAEYIIENKMATKSEYMKLYSESEKNEVEFPSTETIKELNEMDLSLQSYMEYKTELKKANAEKKAEYEKQQKRRLPVSEEEAEKSKTLNTSEKISLIQNEKYTDKERELIYSNYINKDDTMYEDLKKLTNKININQYLDYKSSEFKSDDDPKSNIVGKTISGSKKKKLVDYINNSKFSTIEKLYIYGKQYELSEQQKQQFLKYVDKSGLQGKEKAELLKKMKGIVQYENGKITW